MAQSTKESTGKRKERVGVVMSNRQQKTIVVRVQRRVRHPYYDKVVTKSSKFYAHDEKNDAREGDTVLIRESKPLSKLKRWELVEVTKRGATEEALK